MKPEILRTIKKTIVHDSCPDGLAAAMIVKDALPDVKIEFVQYNTKRHMTMEPEPGVMFVDFTPWAEREKEPPHALTARGLELAKAWVDAGAIVLDHHEGAADLVALFGERGMYGKNEHAESGAELACKQVWWPVMSGTDIFCEWREEVSALHRLRFGRDHTGVCDFASLAGIRDTWQKGSRKWREACAQAAALMFWPREMLLDAVKSGLFHSGRGTMVIHGETCEVNVGPTKLHEKLAVGEVLLRQQEAADQKTAEEAYRFSVAGVRVACFQGDSRSASDVREAILASGEDVDLVLAWSYFVEREDRDGWASQRRLMKVSARSRKDGFPCHALAQMHGGNGHQGAAGFRLEVGGTSHNPYTVLEGLVLGYTGAAAPSGGVR